MAKGKEHFRKQRETVHEKARRELINAQPEAALRESLAAVRKSSKQSKAAAKARKELNQDAPDAALRESLAANGYSNEQIEAIIKSLPKKKK